MSIFIYIGKDFTREKGCENHLMRAAEWGENFKWWLSLMVNFGQDAPGLVVKFSLAPYSTSKERKSITRE